MVDIMRNVVVLYISYIQSCLLPQSKAEHVTDINWDPFNPIFHFLFKTHSAKTNLLFISVKYDNKLASLCTSTMADLNYCILDNSYTEVHVFIHYILLIV